MRAGKMAVIGWVLAVTVLGCTLTNPAPTPGAIPIASVGVNTQAPATRVAVLTTPTPTPTPTRLAVQGGGSAGSTNGSNAPSIPCRLRTDWIAYVVVVGDTLSSIASRAGTTTETLVLANCLANANVIRIGQTLYVPSYPVQPTSHPHTSLGYLTFSPTLQTNGYVQVAMGAAVTIVWEGVPLDLPLTRVDFYYQSIRRPDAGTLISADLNPVDGIAVTWIVPDFSEDDGVLQAIAYRADGGTLSPPAATSIRIRSAGGPPTPMPFPGPNTVTFTPNRGYEGGAYRLAPGRIVTLSWGYAEVGTARVVFTLTPTGTGMGDAATIIGGDDNPSDGVSMMWMVPTGIVGHVQAKAMGADGAELNVSELTLIYTE